MDRKITGREIVIMVSLVGYTGFVGSNLYAFGKFDQIYNSKNIQEAYGTKPDLLVYSGLPAEKYLANLDPKADWNRILQAERNIRKIEAKRVVLISTVDVFQVPVVVDEDTEVNTEGLHAYGRNRYALEEWVRGNCMDAAVIRLPGLYGKNLKKNFLYDYIYVIPSKLSKEKFCDLSDRAPQLRQYYEPCSNGFYQCRALKGEEREKLKSCFQKLGFTALNFTDSRNIYQFYPLNRLWEDINIILKHHVKLWHPATQPVSAGEIYRFLTRKEFVNEIEAQPVFYDYRTKYGELFGRSGGYILNKQEVLEDIQRFVEKSAAMMPPELGQNM